MTETNEGDSMAQRNAAALAAAVAIWSGPALAAADPATAQEEKTAAENAARTALESALHQTTALHVEKATVMDGWAFVYAHILSPDGHAYDYKGTPWEEAARGGGKSTVYAGLLRREPTGWRLVAQAVGPTDMAWSGWSREYSAPESIFQIPVD